MRKAQASNREIGLASLIMIVIILYVYFTAPHESVIQPGQPFQEKCEFQGNFTCYSVLLRRGSSRVEISINQTTGKLINITSFVCTNSSNIPAMPLLNNTVLVPTGKGNDISGGNSGNNVICTGEDGMSIPNASAGDVYYGKIYFTYSEVRVNTSAVKLVNGTLVAKYS